MDTIMQLISTVGFPIAIAVYLLWERDKSTKKLTQAITDLTILIKAKLK